MTRKERDYTYDEKERRPEGRRSLE